MRFAIISDTHDDVDRTDRSVSMLKRERIETVLHLGDWVAPFMVRRFRGLKVIGLLGNNDRDLLALRRVLEDDIGGEMKGDFAELELGGKKLALIHGTHRPLVEALAKAGDYDLVAYGHTHEKDDRRVGRTRVLNPGVETVILYDTATDEATFVPVEGTNSMKLRSSHDV